MSSRILGTHEPIHTVTGIHPCGTLEAGGVEYQGYDTRCFGWYPTLNGALEAASSNASDINEAGEYPWLVVESPRPGVYGGAVSARQHWFRWVQEGTWAGEGHYEPCQPPEGIATEGDIGFVGFGMG